MRIFHMSDLHIGLRLYNRDLLEDQKAVLAEAAALAGQRQPDAVLIAGDIYDKPIPPAEAVEVFDRFLTDLTQKAPKAEIMIISGNHDSGARVNCFRSVLARQHVHMIGLPPQREEDRIEKVVLEDAFGKVNFYLLPFVRPSMVRLITGTGEDGRARSYAEAVAFLLERDAPDPAERNVLVSHQFYLPGDRKAEDIERMDSEIRMVGNIDEIPASVLEPYDYAALGHIHKPMKAGKDIFRYCGTPMACSVSEAGQEKGLLEVELGPKGEAPVIRPLPLHAPHGIRRVRGTLEEVLSQACDDYVQVTLTDRIDLDFADVRDRLRAAFPGLLEIRRDLPEREVRDRERGQEREMDPYELCLAFLGDLDEETDALLRDVINTVKGGGE